MAVAENAPNFDNAVVSSGSNAQNDLENPKPRNESSGVLGGEPNFQSNSSDQNSQGKFQNQEKAAPAANFSVPTSNHKTQIGQMQNGFDTNGVNNSQIVVVKSGGYGIDHMSNGMRDGGDGDESFKRDMRDLEELLSKLNPMAEEFVPPSLAKNHGYPLGTGFGLANNFLMHTDNSGNANGLAGRRVSVILPFPLVCSVAGKKWRKAKRLEFFFFL